MASNATLPPGAREGFQADLKAQRKQAARAALLLEQATACLHAEQLEDTTADRAQRLRGAAVLVTSAAIEIAITCGWLESAHAAELNGLVEPEVEP